MGLENDLYTGSHNCHARSATVLAVRNAHGFNHRKRVHGPPGVLRDPMAPDRDLS
jgi:hypothetical protein